jgi:electron transfer flavoprotein beta subunit
MAFHIVVCIKAVMLKAPKKTGGRSAASMVMNPYDGAALEMALQIQEKKGGTVTALSMGPEASSFVLHEARAMGVDRGVLLCDRALAGSDTLATSTALTAGLEKLKPFDLVLFGTRTADSDTGQVGPQVAVALDLPLVTWVRHVSWNGDDIAVERQSDGFVERYEISLPAAMTIDPAVVVPRDLDLVGIDSAFEKGFVEVWDIHDLGLKASEVGLEGSPTIVVSMKKKTRKRTCALISGSAEEQVEKLISSLTDLGLIGR